LDFDLVILNASKRPSFAEIFDIESMRVQNIEKKIELQKQSEFESRARAESQAYLSMGDDDLLSMLMHTRTLQEEADILQCLFENKQVESFVLSLPGYSKFFLKLLMKFKKLRGLDWSVESHFPGLKLKNLVEKLYEKASIQKIWWLVRHTGGMLALNPDETSKVNLFLFMLIK